MSEVVQYVIPGAAVAVFIAIIYWVCSGLFNSNKTAPAPDEPVVIARFTAYPDAEMARLRLEGQGIRAFVVGGTIAGTFRASVYSSTGIQLKVMAKDAERAHYILNHSDEEMKDQPVV